MPKSPTARHVVLAMLVFCAVRLGHAIDQRDPLAPVPATFHAVAEVAIAVQSEVGCS